MTPLDVIQTFPTAIWTVPLGALVFFWILAILGAFDIDMFDVDADVDVELDLDGDVPNHSGFSSLLTDALAIGTVPLTIVISSVAAFGWIGSVAAELTIAGLARDLVGPWVYGAGMLAVTFILAVWLTTFVVKPLKPVFTTHSQHEGDTMMGQIATLTSSRVTSSFGTATAKAADGTSLNLNVVCDEPTSLSVGDEVTIVAYDEEAKHYVIAPMDASKRIAAVASDAPPGAVERLPSELNDGRSGRPDTSSADQA